MVKRQKSQSAIEFIILSSFMLLATLSIFSTIGSNFVEYQDESSAKTAEDIANVVNREVETAKSVNDGYARVFLVPEKYNGVNYNITMIDGRELVVNYLDFEFVKFLPANVSGNVSKGLNIISKVDGKIIIGQVLLTQSGDLIIRGASNAARFRGNGELILRGTLQQSVNPINPTPADEFIFRDSSSVTVAMINLGNGNMYIKGTLFENQASLNPSLANDDFIVRDGSGNVVAYIDELSGNLYLKSILIQNGNP